MDVSRHKKFLSKLVKEINLGAIVEPLQFNFQTKATTNMRIHSESRGSLWLLARKSGFSVGLRLRRDQQMMFEFLQCLTGRPPDGYHHPNDTQPYWNIFDWEVVRKVAFFFADGMYTNSTAELYPDQAEAQREGFKYWEGAIQSVRVNRYERDPKARLACIEHYGCTCQICNINFGEVYGDLGTGFIHVHHLNELSSLQESTQTNPVKDLIPVCPNCHAMLHRETPPITPAELKRRMKDTDSNY